MFKKIIHLGAIYYTSISGVFLLLALMFGGALAILEPSKLIFIMLFSFVASIGSVIKKDELMKKVPSSICHAVCYIGGFFFCIVLPYKNGFTSSVILLSIFSIGYAIVCIVKSIIQKNSGKDKKATSKNTPKKGTAAQKASQDKKNTNKKAKKETEYKSLFSDNK